VLIQLWSEDGGEDGYRGNSQQETEGIVIKEWDNLERDWKKGRGSTLEGKDLVTLEVVRYGKGGGDKSQKKDPTSVEKGRQLGRGVVALKS